MSRTSSLSRTSRMSCKLSAELPALTVIRLPEPNVKDESNVKGEPNVNDEPNVTDEPNGKLELDAKVEL